MATHEQTVDEQEESTTGTQSNHDTSTPSTPSTTGTENNHGTSTPMVAQNNHGTILPEASQQPGTSGDSRISEESGEPEQAQVGAR
ncbi:hypothetical protein [Streptomyces sp. AA1529]|uniref:hypothetical protein n=1 Tax=Streptomyces sp. AA1529 TaxID=1203257 RepID=UPI003D71790E